MSPLWLILIIPVTFCSGFVLSGLMTNAKRTDKCNDCQFNKFMSERDQ